MIRYLYIIISFGIAGPFVSSHEVLTIQEFQQWRCSSICTDSAMKAHVKGICLQIETNLPDRYDDRSIKSLSQCEKEISVEFKDGDTVLMLGFPREVGMCYLSKTITKCITKGSKENSVYIYSYVDRACRDLQEFDYDFSIPPFVGLFITPLQFIQWKCSSICKNPALQKHVIKICSQLSTEIPTENRFETDRMSAMNGCKNDISVEFEKDNGWINGLGFRETVAMCYLSPAVTKCLTKGPEENSIFVYSYTYDVCHTPKQIDYDFGLISTPTNEKTGNSVTYSGIAQLLASNTQIPSTSTVKGEGDTATAETDQPSVSSTSHSSIPKIEKGNPAIAETAQFPISTTSVSRTPSIKEKGDIVIAETANSPVPKTPTLQRKERTMSVEKPLPKSPTLTQSPSKKNKRGILCSFVNWIKSWF